MSTELATLSRNKELSEVEQIIAAEEDVDAFVPQLPWYKLVSQTGQFQSKLDEDDISRELSGIILMSRITRALWGNQANIADLASGRPRCFSIGGRSGTWQEEDGSTKTVRCATCPYNQWGSAIREDGSPSRGKACKEMRRLLLFLDGHSLPAVLSLPPTSCRSFDQFASALASKGSAYWAVRTVIGAERAMNEELNQRYSIATFAKDEQLGTEMLQAVLGGRRQFEAALGVAPEYDEYYAEDGNGRDSGTVEVAEEAPWPTDDDLPY